MLVQRVDQLIGNTPLIRLNSLSDDEANISVYGKLEAANPAFSVKDRSALELLRRAAMDYDLSDGWTIVESTSGNMGHALAMLCAIYKYRFVCVLDPKTPKTNINLVKAFGGEVEIVSTPDENGGFQKNRIKVAKEIERQLNRCVNLDQYNNPAAIDAHYKTTGPEIHRQLCGQVDVLIASVSTGSHLSGTARYLKETCSKVLTVGVEPQGSVIFGGTYKPYLQNGAGLSFRPGNILTELVDQVVRVSDYDAFLSCRQVALADGLLLGGSSGAVIHVAKEFAAKAARPCNIVVVLPDSGMKYLDTIYDDQWLINHGLKSVVDAMAPRTRPSQRSPIDLSRLFVPESSTIDSIRVNDTGGARYDIAFPELKVDHVSYQWRAEVGDALAGQMVDLLRHTTASAPIIGFGETITDVEAHNYIAELRTSLAAGKSLLMTMFASTGALIGLCTLRRNLNPNNRHIADLAKGMIHEKYRRHMVLPAAFFEIALRCENEDVDVVTLDVRSDSPAQRVWENFGFETYGVLPDYARIEGKNLPGHFMMQKVANLKSRALSVLQLRHKAEIRMLEHA
jgi:2,3-diaminopropionate biosynthesis protein SbnA